MKNFPSQNKSFEIDFFSSLDLGREWDFATSESFLYLKRIFFRFLDTSNNLRFLDAGCGTGTFGRIMLEVCPTFQGIGVDITPRMIEFANKINIFKNYKVMLGDLENRELFGENTFDLIICRAIFHHFPVLTEIFSNLTYWLKPNGLIIIFESNGSNPVNKMSEFVRRCIEVIFGKEFIIKHKWATPNETDHSVGTYIMFLRKNGYEILFCDTNYFGDEDLSIRGRAKDTLYKASNILPFPFKGSGIVIVAKK